MREEGSLGAEHLDGPQRLLHGRMCGMRLMSERIQKQHIQTAQLFHRGLGNVTMVGKVGSISETISVNDRASVVQQDRLELEPENIDGIAGDRLLAQLWDR